MGQPQWGIFLMRHLCERLSLIVNRWLLLGEAESVSARTGRAIKRGDRWPYVVMFAWAPPAKRHYLDCTDGRSD